MVLYQNFLSLTWQVVPNAFLLLECCSEFRELSYGVPQGSVLGPIEFCIYTTALGAILRHYNIDYHIYADDIQLYSSFDLKSPSEAINQIQLCISDIRTWMVKNKLKINDDKTEFLMITSSRANQPKDIELHIGQEIIRPSTTCKSLGVILEDHCLMDNQIKHICRATHFHLRNISSIRNILTKEAAAQLVHSLVTSRLEYSNSLLFGLPDTRTAPLQRLQNIAARIVSCSKPQNHITPVLKSLHWLPIKFRIRFKNSINDLSCY